MNPSIFISYRRDDTEYAASAIDDRLAAHFGRETVFRDVELIAPGQDFSAAINNAIRKSNVFLVLIGDNWLRETGSDGNRRIDNPSDWVRAEIEIAFKENKPVIPVLVGDAVMPPSGKLPESLRQLSYLNAVVLRSGKDFSANIDRLIKAIETYVAKSRVSEPILDHDIRSETSEEETPAIQDKNLSGPSAGSVFISYRREGGAETARLMRYELLARNWRVFLDVEDLKAGQFDSKLLSEVAAADNFLLILSPKSLDNCAQENDWLRKEIKQALETKRNIVPLLKENTRRPDQEGLPPEIDQLKTFNCVDYSHVYYDATVSKLLSFLSEKTA